MELNEKIARYQEIERRGLLNKLPAEKQAIWEEIKRRGLDKQPMTTTPQAQTLEAIKDPYSALDKAKYMGRAGAEGLTFGLGDIVAGATNVIAKPLGTATGAILGEGKFQASDLNPIKSFKEGRGDFINEQNQFAQYHPLLNLTGEIVGGLPTGVGGAGKAVAKSVGKNALKNAVLKSAKEGAKYGAAYGAGSGLTQDADRFSVKNAFLGGLGGGVLGGAFGGGLTAGGRGLQRYFGTKAFAQREAQNIINEAGGKDIDKIVRSDKGTRALKEAIKSDDRVAKTVRELANDKIVNSADKTKQLIENTLGIDDIVRARENAQMLYDDVVNNSNVSLPKSIYDNQAVRKALQKEISEDIMGELKAKGIDSLYAAQSVKENLDDMIQKSYVLDNYGILKPTRETRKLMAAKTNFLNTVDTFAPEYKHARTQFEQAVKPYDLLEGLTKDTGRERSNTINSILTNKNKRSIAKVFGRERANELFRELRNQSVENDRFNKLYSAAENQLTKEKPQTQGTVRETLESAGSIVGNAIDKARLGGAKRGRRRIGEILLGMEERPSAINLNQLANNAKQTINNEGGFVRVSGKPKVSQILNSEGKPVANTEEGVKNFQKWFGNSKVVDENGRPKVFHHKTYYDNIEEFRVGKGSNAAGKGIYFSERPEGRYGNIDYPVYLDVKNPLYVDGMKNSQSLYARKKGYDGIIDKNTGYVIVFNPNQIKSVKNSGKFDPKNPNIYKSLIGAGGLGSISQILNNKEIK